MIIVPHFTSEYFTVQISASILTPWTVSTSSSDSIREKMKKNYMSNPSYNYDQVNRASLACGPMVKWAIAQVRKPKQYER